jgi:hypothetical protein
VLARSLTQDFLEFKMEGETVEMLETGWTRRLDEKARRREERCCPLCLLALFGSAQPSR